MKELLQKMQERLVIYTKQMELQGRVIGVGAVELRQLPPQPNLRICDLPFHAVTTNL